MNIFKRIGAWLSGNSESTVSEAEPSKVETPENAVVYMTMAQVARLTELDARVGDPVKALCATFSDWKRWNVTRDWKSPDYPKTTDKETGVTIKWGIAIMNHDKDRQRVGIWRDLPLVPHDISIDACNQPWMTKDELEYMVLMARKTLSDLAPRITRLEAILQRRRSREQYRDGLLTRATMMEKYVGIEEGDEWDKILKKREEIMRGMLQANLAELSQSYLNGGTK
ncbi:hypothetical protein QE320_gp015 [Pseudomonas phage EM]|uniref:Uncharacterized protein n=1 Tax=Pseudomonas phage EM TaxID=2936914 RepID=A0AAE9HLS7_9CAUD|nr:hypothetical protein QE320_gp015 [Pseudomonas phage EM]UPW35817.1 hypothetical protein EM_015 [Pseudomonas phage EM]